MLKNIIELLIYVIFTVIICLFISYTFLDFPMPYEIDKEFSQVYQQVVNNV